VLPTLNAATAAGFGLGILVRKTPYGTKYSHDGDNPGFSSYFAIYDEKKLGYVFFVNNDQAPALRKALDGYLITGMLSK
jgi:hypothetical protein